MKARPASSMSVRPLWFRPSWGRYPTVRAAGLTTSPESGSSRPASILSRVVLPAPFGPLSPTRSRSSICQLTASSSTRSPKVLLMEESWIIQEGGDACNFSTAVAIETASRDAAVHGKRQRHFERQRFRYFSQEGSGCHRAVTRSASVSSAQLPRSEDTTPPPSQRRSKLPWSWSLPLQFSTFRLPAEAGTNPSFCYPPVFAGGGGFRHADGASAVVFQSAQPVCSRKRRNRGPTAARVIVI